MSDHSGGMGGHDSTSMPKPGDLIAGKYRIEALIGKGGMGAVYAAQHELLFQRVAVKVLLTEAVSTPEAVTRFLNEARSAARIQNEHVARVMDVGTAENGHPYMVIEYLEGADLAVVLEQRGKIPFTEAVDWVLEALEAIAQAHAFGIVHRDLKPSNLFLAKRQNGSSVVKVLDFGISKSTNPFGGGADMALTSTKAMLGSPLYMSPEQLRSSKSVDTRADVWALGVILHELLAGAVPFHGDSLGELFVAILEQEPQSLRAISPEVPPGLEQVVRRCLLRNADHRYPTVAELAQALAPFASPRLAAAVERIVATVGPRAQQMSPSASTFAVPSTTSASASQGAHNSHSSHGAQSSHAQGTQGTQGSNVQGTQGTHGTHGLNSANSAQSGARSGPFSAGSPPFAITPAHLTGTAPTGGPGVDARTGQSFVTTAAETKRPSVLPIVAAAFAVFLVVAVVVGGVAFFAFSRKNADSAANGGPAASGASDATSGTAANGASPSAIVNAQPSAATTPIAPGGTPATPSTPLAVPSPAAATTAATATKPSSAPTSAPSAAHATTRLAPPPARPTATAATAATTGPAPTAAKRPAATPSSSTYDPLIGGRH